MSTENQTPENNTPQNTPSVAPKRGMKLPTKIALGLVGTLALVGTAASIAVAKDGHGYGHGGHGKHQRGQHMEMMLDKFDTNGDSALSRAEVEAGRAMVFTQADGDTNGGVSLDEFRGIWAEMTEHRMVRGFQRLDRDGDGIITTTEFEKPIDRMFSKMDRNNDGMIDKSDRKHRWHDDDDDDDDDDYGKNDKN